MSIRINPKKCIGCGKCREVCPGNLIKTDSRGKAIIQREKDCWGCTSCLKECKTDAISFFLGADIGGRGSTLSVKTSEDFYTWTVTDPKGQKKTIEINRKDSNRY
jgi:adenylylsulfate reductase subunit B